MEFGEINGIPRLLDIGQCNDAYSVIQLALALAEAFSCEVNELPLSLGIKNIRVGPIAPAFLMPTLRQTLEVWSETDYVGGR